mmetsp:Transcript_11688/g.28792  ORF Transcript_11688/g.28792 Transcript_11688/m.28792 type:complete len:336 (-) Transcript_11688:284-1291(-)
MEISLSNNEELKPLSKGAGINIAVEGKGGELGDSESPAQLIESEWGDCEVVVIGDRKKPAVVTYPDAGTNYDSCFKGFFRFIGSNTCFKHFCFVHINPPGQHFSAPKLEAQLSMEDLRKHFEFVLEKVGVSKAFHGFGLGMGAYLMLDYASKHPNRLLSLTLISPTAQKSWYFDWVYEKMNIYANHYFRYDTWWKDQFLKRWFHRYTIKENTNLVEMHEKLFFRINQENVYNIQRAFTSRPDITKELLKIKCRTLIAVADGSLLENEAVAVMGGMADNIGVTWIKVRNAGSFLTEEAPRCLLHPINLFHAGAMGTAITKDMLEYSQKLQVEGDER